MLKKDSKPMAIITNLILEIYNENYSSQIKSKDTTKIIDFRRGFLSTVFKTTIISGGLSLKPLRPIFIIF